jgi:biotin-(acetyl-CoA carboxylase) ligase
VLDLHASAGFHVLRPRFDALFRMRGEAVQVREPGGGAYEGRVIGVDPDGALRLASASGERRVLAGEITLSSEASA